MKKHLLFLSALVCMICGAICAQTLEGDFYIEEISVSISPYEGKADTILNKTWFTKDKFRREQGTEGRVTIGCLDKGLFWIIDLTDSTYSELNLAVIRQMSILSVGMMGPQIDANGQLKVPDDLYIKTGEKTKIGQWNTEKVVLNENYTKSGLIQNFAMWISPDTEIPSGLYSGLMKNILGDPNGELKKLLDLWGGLRGYPIRVEIQAMGYTTITTTTKIERRKAPEGIFDLPEGMTEVTSPFMEQLKSMPGQ